MSRLLFSLLCIYLISSVYGWQHNEYEGSCDAHSCKKVIDPGRVQESERKLWEILTDQINRYADSDKINAALLDHLKPEYSCLRKQLTSRKYDSIFELLQDIEDKAEQYRLDGTTNARTYGVPCRWRSASKSALPKQAYIAALSPSGEPIYIGRTKHNGHLLPAGVDNLGNFGVTFDSAEWPYRDYEILVAEDGCELSWESASEGHVPSGALQGGQTADGERLYIGRVYQRYLPFIGKVHPSKRRCYVAIQGLEQEFDTYEVLVLKSTNFA